MKFAEINTANTISQGSEECTAKMVADLNNFLVRTLAQAESFRLKFLQNVHNFHLKNNKIQLKFKFLI